MSDELDPRAAGARRLRDKVCIVTGAGQGIGRAAAKRLGQEGGKIVVADRVEPAAEQTVGELRQHGVDAVCHYDLSALLPQALRRSASDALSRSGHDADLVPQPSGTCRPRIALVGHLPEFLRVTLLLRRTFGVGPHV